MISAAITITTTTTSIVFVKTSSSLYPPLTFPARFFTAAPGTLVESNAKRLCA